MALGSNFFLTDQVYLSSLLEVFSKVVILTKRHEIR